MIRLVLSLLLLFACSADAGMQVRRAGHSTVSTLTRSDNFNRSNENPLGNGNWTRDTAQVGLKIVSNQIEMGASASTSYWSADTFGANQYSQVKVVSNVNGTNYNGPMVRHANNVSYTQGYVAYVDYGTVVITRTGANPGAVTTSLCTGISPNGKVMKLTVSGTGTSTTLRVYFDGTECGSGATDTSGNALSSGNVGVRSNGAVFDDWEGGEL